MQNLFIISLRGLPVDELMSMQRIRMSQKVSIVHENVLVSASSQILDDQGSTWQDFALSQDIKSNRAVGTRPCQRLKLPSVQELREQAEAVLTKRRQQVAAAFGVESDAESESGDGDEQEDEEKALDGLLSEGMSGKKPLPKTRQAPTAAAMLCDGPPAKAAGKSKRKAQAVDDDETLGAANDEDEVDPELLDVQKKHTELVGGSNRSKGAFWSQLRVENALSGNFDGRVLTAAGSA